MTGDPRRTPNNAGSEQHLNDRKLYGPKKVHQLVLMFIAV